MLMKDKNTQYNGSIILSIQKLDIYLHAKINN